MKISLIASITVMLLSFGTNAANTIKPYHESALDCRTCHTNKDKYQRPNAQICIECHGGMSEIPTKPNSRDKNPHSSHHYEDLLDCTVCHSEHKHSEAICSECHVVEFPNLK